jgi:hypothetical protein
VTKLISNQLFTLLVLSSIAFWQIVSLVRAYRAGEVRTGYFTNKVLSKSENPQRFQWELVARIIYIVIIVAAAAADFWIGSAGQS